MTIDYTGLNYEVVSYNNETFTLAFTDAPSVTGRNIVELKVVPDDATHVPKLMLYYAGFTGNADNPDDHERGIAIFLITLIHAARFERLDQYLNHLSRIIGADIGLPMTTKAVEVVWNNTALQWHYESADETVVSLEQTALATVACVLYTIL